MCLWEILSCNTLNCGWWKVEGSHMPWREWESAREEVVNVNCPTVFIWAFTGDCSLTIQSKIWRRNSCDRRKRGLPFSHVRGRRLGVHSELGFGWDCSLWRETLEVVRWHAQSRSIHWVHWIVPDYFMLLIATSFSLYEENERWSNYLVNTRSSE